LVKYVGLEVEGFIEEYESRLELTEYDNNSNQLRLTHVFKAMASLNNNATYVI
jgi:hypothetical protein